MKRRVFLRRISTALTGMGLGSQLSVPIQSLLPVLAQSSGRKLALLVGINHYTNHSHNSNPSQLPPIAPIPLNGCVTDVELQRELLIHRFGFRPSDILTLTNEEATRTNIESAFVESSFPASTVRGSGSFSFQRLWESITSS
ncbi:MAG: caspase family protein [Cyanobacteria bacterium LVE1205-1]